MSESQTPALDPRCQSTPSARNSFVLSEGGFSKNYGADQQRLQISDLHFDNFSTSATFACWKIKCKTEVYPLQEKGQSAGANSPKRGPFPPSKTDRLLVIYEYFRVTGANDSVEKFADLFTTVLRNYDIQEFDSKWDGIFNFNDENPI